MSVMDDICAAVHVARRSSARHDPEAVRMHPETWRDALRTGIPGVNPMELVGERIFGMAVIQDRRVPPGVVLVVLPDAPRRVQAEPPIYAPLWFTGIASPVSPDAHRYDASRDEAEQEMAEWRAILDGAKGR